MLQRPKRSCQVIVQRNAIIVALEQHQRNIIGGVNPLLVQIKPLDQFRNQTLWLTAVEL
ncbi:hypothetical protein [Gimesia chilikensis]|uniref:hypothetical protein n=1 Tax=Gimesia chilikensis TaxID=2605989 RepID=UPI00118A76DA|nr:hypothetical protein [Gimesia chilikensis]QDT87333.1 hypothetical protein MalM14_50180 [Gimesia chilikensis]